ncbi:MAG TPA: aryl-sulfate sulfotransferase [Thermoanaerobaculia bacterium]|nr:aryl-sulfate sulfotransferase [Thermoanaerobaculia bacterium]
MSKNRQKSVLSRGSSACRAGLLAAVLAALGAQSLEAAITATVASSPQGPAPVGTMVAWTAKAAGVSGEVWYRFRERAEGGSFRMIRDFGPLDTLDWTALDEGTWEIEVAVRARSGGEIATARSLYEIQSRVRDGRPAVSPTSHPLVFLFSDPGCDAGIARVEIRSAAGEIRTTPWRPCSRGRSFNIYVAGLEPGAAYSASIAVDRGRGTWSGTPVSFTAGTLSPGLVRPTVVVPYKGTATQGVLLQAVIGRASVATDLSGKVLWYGPSDINYVTHPESGGTFFGLIQSKTDPAREVIRLFDLVGTTQLETNAARVNEQLAAAGRRQISGFHHEVRFLSDGRILVLAMVEQILPYVQGSGPLDIIGDMILVLDADLNVVWTWDTFDHLDISRRAVLNETCKANGCDHHYLADDGNDWTHGNAVSETPGGDLLYSTRSQDWLIKISYRGGAGDGTVLWRLGKDGDFALETFGPFDPWPWFSHQHGPSYEPDSLTAISVFDNGNTRVPAFPGNSRGQVYVLDEDRRTATRRLNLDLGMYSFALGSAQRLRDGTYHFDLGAIFDAASPSKLAGFSVQVDPSTNDVLCSTKLLAGVYRSWRLDDLYGSVAAPLLQPGLLVPFRP